eukprot:m.88187 g.88187  ORF g.88187 m.88187 type:complete len:169 (+) comp36565_c0_seq2:63-569(+)
MIKFGTYTSYLRQFVVRSNITAGSKALRHRLNIESLPSSSIIKEAVAKSVLRRWRLLLPLGAAAGAMTFGFMEADLMDIPNETTGNAGDLADGANKHHESDSNEEPADHDDDKTKEKSPNKSTATHDDSADKSDQWKSKLIRLGGSVGLRRIIGGRKAILGQAALWFW